MEKVAGIMFLVSWLLCSCSAESFFEGGAPFAILAALVAMGCAAILGKGGKDGKSR